MRRVIGKQPIQSATQPRKITTMGYLTTGRSNGRRCLHFRRQNRQQLFLSKQVPRFAVPSSWSSLSPRQSSPISIRRCSRSFWTLSFSGAGHLMPYHLGVAKTLSARESPNTNKIAKEKTPNALYQLPIKSVSGSSSGAIAATVMTLMPHRLEEYTERFLQDRGHAFKNLREIMLEEAVEDDIAPKGLLKSSGPMLSICTTRCSDGGVELFSFGGGLNSNEESDETKKRLQEQFYRDGEDNGDEEQEHHERLLKAIEASCRIPRSFHPIDMVALNYKYLLDKLPNTPENTYPDEEGIVIDGKGYVDGGIAAPFPPTPLDGDLSCTGRIVVSPIAGEYFYKTDKNISNNLPQPMLKAIRPENDTSWMVPLIDSLTLSGSGCRDDDDESAPPMVAVRATPSLQNLRVLTTAMGVVSASPNDNNSANDDKKNGGGGVLRDWYERGQADAHEMLNKL